jgi:hypothetical protein
MHHRHGSSSLKALRCSRSAVPRFVALARALFLTLGVAIHGFAQGGPTGAITGVVLWAGLKGENVPYPAARDGSDLRHNRQSLVKTFFRREAAEPTTRLSVAKE